MTGPETDRNERGKKLTGREDWVEISRDDEWQEDILAEEGSHANSSQPSPEGDNMQLKSSSVVSLLKEFCLKAINTSSSGVGRRAGGSGAGNSSRD
ncbi:hypothetical protein VM1G_11738 [Cytospora mali]|uniref:Uncharacterized protein n=1 Tax=Cytospora mali TaxID=578113 RepID=A0A194W6K9_CYTMA|nr:hypothetical protein VM1G_11738 [Valsa mali]